MYSPSSIEAAKINQELGKLLIDSEKMSDQTKGEKLLFLSIEARTVQKSEENEKYKIDIYRTLAEKCQKDENYALGKMYLEHSLYLMKRIVNNNDR